MKKIFLVVVLILSATMIFAGGQKEDVEKSPADTKDEQEIMQFKWAASYPIDHPYTKAMEEAVSSIADKTNGIIQIEFHPANTLGSESEITDMVRMGSILGAQIGFQMFQQYVPGIGGWSLPFVFENTEQLSRFLKEYAVDNVWNKEVLEATGVRVLTATPSGMRQLTTKGIPVKKPEDLDGVKIRSMEQPVAIANIKSLGGTPIPIPWNELYTALLTGTVVGQDNPVDNILAAKFYEVQDHLMLTNHSITFNIFCVNEKLWNTIPAKYQGIIKEEFTKSGVKAEAIVSSGEEESIEKLKEYGMTVLRTEDLNMDSFRANASLVIEEVFGKHKDYDALMKYRKIALDWIDNNF